MFRLAAIGIRAEQLPLSAIWTPSGAVAWPVRVGRGRRPGWRYRWRRYRIARPRSLKEDRLNSRLTSDR
jgi:hypothetical protein